MCHVKSKSAVKLFTLHNELKVIRSAHRIVSIDLFICETRRTSKYEKMDTQTQIKRASVCQRQEGNSHARFNQSVHMLTCSEANVHIVHAHMNTDIVQCLRGTSHISHFALYRPCLKETNRSSEQTLKDNLHKFT